LPNHYFLYYNFTMASSSTPTPSPSTPSSSSTYSTPSDEFVICKHFVSGYCRLGDRCSFTHVKPATDKRYASCSSADNDTPSFVPHKICSFYVKGNCQRGKKCTFLHPNDNTQKVYVEPGSYVLPDFVLHKLERMNYDARTRMAGDLKKTLFLVESIRKTLITDQLIRIFPEVDPLSADSEFAAAVLDSANGFNIRDRQKARYDRELMSSLQSSSSSSETVTKPLTSQNRFLNIEIKEDIENLKNVEKEPGQE
jgi:hypothetical protein